ncbi:MotA/TolQ/ExbB proton channel family protein [Nocardioides sp.]|uniref:MotA/TolQ/ExbB proton channel family protein n=1 Tax=Nocardioides sp. TaxID=35761 RepID=UPI003518B2CC
MIDSVYQAIFDLSEALEIPVVLATLLAVALVVVEIGALIAETLRRRRRDVATLHRAADAARAARDAGDPAAAGTALAAASWSPVMARTAAEMARTVEEHRIAKLLADFDFDRQRVLGRTRLLVRWGPALGLMGTLIPLAPALEGLADGDVTALSDNLRLAFSVTVLGLLIGAVAFGISLRRDRVYAQDYSDLEYVAAVLTAPAGEAVR